MTEEQREAIRQRAIKRLREAEAMNTEEGHIEADNALCEMLNDLGFADVVDIFAELSKWYA